MKMLTSTCSRAVIMQDTGLAEVLLKGCPGATDLIYVTDTKVGLVNPAEFEMRHQEARLLLVKEEDERLANEEKKAEEELHNIKRASLRRAAQRWNPVGKKLVLVALKVQDINVTDRGEQLEGLIFLGSYL
jgi:hypothetical protein